MRFTHVTLPQRVRFASGGAARELADEVALLGSNRVMIITTPSLEQTARRLGHGLPVARWHAEVVPHVPVEVADRARRVATEDGADLLVCIGGGSATGLAKAVALTSGLPIIAVPTTYAGSEATDVWGLTEGARKATGVDARVLPHTVIYDAELSRTLPVELSVVSGLNALAHCVESFWAPRGDPINQALATEGIRALSRGLPQIVKRPDGLPGRELVLYGTYLAAVAFASAGSGLHHKICHVLGGMFELPHAQTHAIVLPHVLALNAGAAPDLDARIAAAFDAPSATAGLSALRSQLNAPTALREFGLPEDRIPDAAAAVLPHVPAANPAFVDQDRLVALLRAAWAGDAPGPSRTGNAS